MLTSISTLTLDTFGSRRPWADVCGSARLRSILSAGPRFGSLAAAAVMHARSSTETSCVAVGLWRETSCAATGLVAAFRLLARRRTGREAVYGASSPCLVA